MSPGTAPTSASVPQPTPGTRRKRSQVARACDWCRKHRTKCDQNTPCSNCRGRGVHCSNTDAGQVTTAACASREIERLQQHIQVLRQQLQEERTKSSSRGHQLSSPTPPDSLTSPQVQRQESVAKDDKAGGKQLWGGISVRNTRSPHETWYGPSSLFYFIGRITDFLSGSLHQAHTPGQIVLHSVPTPFDGSPTEPREFSSPGPLTLQVDSIAKQGDLSPTQEEYFLDLYWHSYHTSLFPILDETEFKEHYQSLWEQSGNQRKQSALVDIVIALCMQYGIAMPPHSTQSAALDGTDTTIPGRWHYQRCQTLLAHELESPHVSTVQCHLLCAVYLCCGSFQNMSDGTCALAVRAAYMLGLHLDPPSTVTPREREKRRRLWWALYVLDAKIGMKLGRPFLLHPSDAHCDLPSDHAEAAMQSGSNFAPLGDNTTWLSFNLQNTKLFLAAQAAHLAFYTKPWDVQDGQTIWKHPPTLDAHADHLCPLMTGIQEWASGLPSALKTPRQNHGGTFSTDGSALEIERFAPVWLQRQRLLLELMYHNLCANLYRPFISFDTTPTASHAEAMAIKCALHATTLTDMTYQVLTSTNILAGWHEAFQWQWNAAMTLVGFVLAYPRGSFTAEARGAVDRSVAIFDIFGTSFAVAASAASIVRDLAVKVDFLLQQNQEKEETSMVDRVTPVTCPGGSAKVCHQVDNTLTLDDGTAVSMQDVLHMTFDIDQWNGLDGLWPNPNPSGTF